MIHKCSILSPSPYSLNEHKSQLLCLSGKIELWDICVARMFSLLYLNFFLKISGTCLVSWFGQCGSTYVQEIIIHWLVFYSNVRFKKINQCAKLFCVRVLNLTTWKKCVFKCSNEFPCCILNFGLMGQVFGSRCYWIK